MTKALVVLSGGQDSATCLFWALRAYGAPEVAAVTFDYGQRHRRELQAACEIARIAGIGDRHELIDISGGLLASTSPLVADSRLEEYSDFAGMNAIIGDRVEKTFVPMRNALFLTIAANRAVALGASRLVTGVCQADGANYPDCTDSFIRQQELAINCALGGRFLGIETPLMNLSKAESIRLAVDMNRYTELAWTHTAYSGEFPPITQDHATVLRAHGFEAAGVPDPLIVRAWMEGRLPVLPAASNYPSAGDPKIAGLCEAIEAISREFML